MKKYCIIITSFLLISLQTFAQVEKDAGLWTTFTLQKKVTKQIQLVVDQEFRLRENFQRINLFYTNIGVDFKFNKYFKLSPSYRAIQKMRLNTTLSYRHRLSLDATLKKKFNKVTLAERIRYQIEVQDVLTSVKGKLPEQFLRFKTDVKYALTDKITPFVSCELRYQIRSWRGDDMFYNNGFHRVRNIIGVDYELNYKHSFTVYYLIQNEFAISNLENIYIVGLAYTFSL
ncbi:MAG: DUF2490 domain-containing protein [Sediminibacterium sp.]|nr:DUF2490 domain-containing protein [Sediminibacterium sp.]